MGEIGVKKGGKNEVCSRPKLSPQVKIPKSKAALLRIGEQGGWDCLRIGDWRHKSLEEITYQKLMNRRMKIAQENTGRFFLDICHALYGGRVLKEAEAPLFPEDLSTLFLDPGFRPDIVVSGKLKTTYIEVKAASVNGGGPQFAHRQFLNYSYALLHDPGSEMFAAVFKYGTRKSLGLYVCHNEDGHRCDNRCLVNALSDSTNSLIYLPHNLVTFLLMISPTVLRDHSSSNTTRDFEFYKDPYATWLSFLHKYHETPSLAIEQIMNRTRRRSGGYYRAEVLQGFSIEDFYLGDLVATQRMANNVYCRRRKAGSLRDEKRRKYFLVTEYTNPRHKEWVTHFKASFKDFVEGLGMDKDYKSMLEWREEHDERAGMRDNGKAEILVTSDEAAPF